MRVIESGHVYELQTLDGDEKMELHFVKREGSGYPGNQGTHSGTIIQDVLRACIDRIDYLDNQIPCNENKDVKTFLREAIYALEFRAACRHKRVLTGPILTIEKEPTCEICGHIQCGGHV